MWSHPHVKTQHHFSGYLLALVYVHHFFFFFLKLNPLIFVNIALCIARGHKTYMLQKGWALNNNVHPWRYLGCLYIQGSSSAGTVASILVAHQTTSIHQHKSAQRGANCIRRPSLFLTSQRVCGSGGVHALCRMTGWGREEDWREVWDVREVGEAECDGVWWELAKPTSLQAGVPLVTSAAAGNVSNPLYTQTHTYKRHNSLTSWRWQKNNSEFTRAVSLCG